MPYVSGAVHKRANKLAVPTAECRRELFIGYDTELWFTDEWRYTTCKQCKDHAGRKS